MEPTCVNKRRDHLHRVRCRRVSVDLADAVDRVGGCFEVLLEDWLAAA